MSTLDIALCFDDNFWAPAYAVMRSICLTTKRKADLRFHLLQTGLSAEHRADLERITTEFGARLNWIDLHRSPAFTSFVAGLRQSRQWPPVVYARLLLSELLPAGTSRVVYLDCDMLVRAPIETLFETDLCGHVMGAVKDLNAPMILNGRGIVENRDLFDPAEPYFNSGLMLIDLDAWARLDPRRRVADLKARSVLERLFFDQDLLNIICAGQWQQLPWRWNVIDPRTVHEALDPAVLHYTGPHKPWGILASRFKRTAHTRIYRHTMTNDVFYRFARHRWRRWWGERLPFLVRARPSDRGTGAEIVS